MLHHPAESRSLGFGFFGIRASNAKRLRNVSGTSAFIAASSTIGKRFAELGERGLLDNLRSPKVSPWRTPPHVEALVLRTRADKQYGAQRLSYFLQRYHAVYISVPTIQRILREHQVPRISLKRFRPGPKKRRAIGTPGQSVLRHQSRRPTDSP